MPKKKNSSRYISKAVKDAVRRRDLDICQICGDMSEYMEFDHITPFSKGAPSTIGNIQQLCRKCNLAKRDKTDNDCFKCGGWLSHDAVHCHHCGVTLPKLSKTKSKKGVYEESFWDKTETVFWIFRQIVKTAIFVIASIWVYVIFAHK